MTQNRSKDLGTIENIKDKVRSQTEDAVERLQETRTAVEDSIVEAVQERPFAALAVAMAVGFLLGASWRR